jgi:3-phosphoshikimate 1-carboxyvinyltransferase
VTYQLALLPRNAPLRGPRDAARAPSQSRTGLWLLAALANGTSHLTGALKSDDTGHMAKALQAMGVHVEKPDDTSFLVVGNGCLAVSAEPLFLGNAGTATRFLTAAAAFADGPVVITGDAHMRKRRSLRS